MRAAKQPEAETLDVMDIDKEIRLLLRDLKFAALDALLLRIRRGEISTEELIQLYSLTAAASDSRAARRIACHSAASGRAA